METTTKKENIFTRLNIAEERGKFLASKASEMFADFLTNKDKKQDVVDLLWRGREFCTNAAEDMLMCYFVGACYSKLIMDSKKPEIVKILENLFNEQK